MNNYTLAAQKIKDSVSARDVGEMLGLEIRRGRCQCPIHGGGDFNCVLYSGNRGYYCHVCKSGGDVIKFVQEYQKCSFKDAVAWLNDTFHVGVDLDRKMNPEEQRRAEIALQARKEAREYEEWKSRMRFDLYLAVDRLVEMLEEQRDRNAPKTADEEWNPLFCQAVRLLPSARRFLDRCYADCMKEKRT